jgi:hypothetical protein
MGSPRTMPPSRALAALACLLLAAGCGRDPVSDEPAESTEPLVPIAINGSADVPLQLDTPTYEGSGETVEPDVLHFDQPWHGFEYWMAVNPYPHGNDYHENASILVSHDGYAWQVPPGGHNPVVPMPGGPLHVTYNSDPDLSYLRQQDKLVLVWRGVSPTQNLLFAQTSSDGVTWSDRATTLAVPNHQLISPAIVMVPGRRAKLFTVDAGTNGCTAPTTRVVLRRWSGDLHESDALTGGRWTAPVETDLVAPVGWTLWHLDVIWVEELGEYWAVFPAHQAWESCANSDLFIARSRNGLTWEVLPGPVLTRTTAGFANATLYRASLLYDPAAAGFRIWYSGRSTGGEWHTGHTVLSRNALLRAFVGSERR